MSARRPARSRFWTLVSVLVLAALGAGWVMGALLGGRTLPRLPLLYRRPPTDDLSAKSRTELEFEVRRLRDELATARRRIDDLQIQLKLLDEGSRTGR